MHSNYRITTTNKSRFKRKKLKKYEDTIKDGL